ncbi:unnamed protein product [Thelazia callipaeda]|uniref:Uncharacterized protein n=1 Tax=Thelazia callipaeda TaxID=103827 RepID=A0A0N5CNL3_THECL|nr:unnamed protein product [Thelazia callipaeda]
MSLFWAQKLRGQFNNSAFRFTNQSDHIFIALSLIVSLNNVLRFPIICSESGGILFFIPYALCLIFITIPLTFLENALGQYSSLPSMQLFYHLCPAFGETNKNLNHSRSDSCFLLANVINFKKMKN